MRECPPTHVQRVDASHECKSTHLRLLGCAEFDISRWLGANESSTADVRAEAVQTNEMSSNADVHNVTAIATAASRA